MTRLTWLTDLHLDFIGSDEEVGGFCARLIETDADVVLISGDIATAAALEPSLRLLESCLRRPIYFVLGNHDFYGGSIADVRRRVAALCRQSSCLRWLPEAGVVTLTAEAGVVGHDSWADGRLGHGSRSPFVLNDYFCIHDFHHLSHDEYFARLGELGDEAAAFFQEMLPRAFERHRRMILVTHVPPFREAAWHLGRLSDDNAVPHFTCQAVGDVLRAIMARRPDCHLTVLCGHTHSPGIAQILPNLEVRTGHAEYGVLQVQGDLIVS